ncbi:DUF4145 domain-containing protein [Candidatus Harpocratesius sp.]
MTISSIKIPCKICNIDTNHTLEWEKIIKWGNEDIQGEDEYQVLSCKGCDSLTFRKISSNSEDFNYISNEGEMEYIKTYTYFPERTKDTITPIIDIYKSPIKVREIYIETINAYNSQQPILCSIGVRSIIEAICTEEAIKAKNLKLKIIELKKNGIISKTLETGLHESRLMGNEGAHNLDVCTQENLLTAIKLINNLIEGHYSLPERIEELKKRASKFKK